MTVGCVGAGVADGDCDGAVRWRRAMASCNNAAALRCVRAESDVRRWKMMMTWMTAVGSLGCCVECAAAARWMSWEVLGGAAVLWVEL